MLKKILLGLFCFYGLNSFTQIVKIDSLPVHIEGLIIGAENNKFVLTNQLTGGPRVPYHTIDIDENGTFSTDFYIPVNDFYTGHISNGQSINLILKGNDSIKIYADSKSLLYNTNILGSNDSDAMLQFFKQQTSFKKLEDSLRNVLRNDPSQQSVIGTIFRPYAESFYTYRNTYIKGNANSACLIAAITSVDKKAEPDLYLEIINNVIKTFNGEGIAKLLLRDKAIIEAEINKKEKLAPGKMAPEIAMPNAEGDTLRLSDLKGKVVLIDFWASWCGPCRRENPNVVKAYNKYNKDGFEVYSVSFDKPGMKARWLGAVKQDGLIWPNHVSSLSGFNTKAGRDYGVSGIPFTCLIDKEGNIIATNIRGGALEQHLQKIYGH